MTVHESSRITLSIRNLSKVFRSKHDQVQALDNVNLGIREGELFTLLGPSGCGKTTTLRCIAGFEKPSSGTIDFLGRDFTSIPPFRRNIGMVFQSYALFPHLSIYENVAYGLRIQGINKRRVLDETVEWALQGAALWEEVKDRLEEPAFGLSGGQQQRLVIARAIAVQPKVILLDEPCSALDPIATLEIEELMQELKKEYTIVIVTHNMQQAARASDWTGLFWLGELIEYNDTAAMFTTPEDPKTEAYLTGRVG